MRPEGGADEATGDPFASSPSFVVEISDPEIELEGWLVVHSSLFGGASGGVRIQPDVDRREVELLAEAMSYKYSFHRIRRGGAKCGIKLPRHLPEGERARRLHRFGEHLAPLIRSKKFRPWTDMNCSPVDLANILAGAGRPAAPNVGESSGYTALSIAAGVMVTADHRKLSPSECTVAIEGFGKVGKALAAEISDWGGSLIGVSTEFGAVVNPAGLDVEELLAASQHGDDWVHSTGGWERIERRELHGLPVQFHVPCARIHSITAEVAERLDCQAVVPGANTPCTPEAQEALAARGITLLPDFVTNSGGVLGPRIAISRPSAQGTRGYFFGDFKDMLARLMRSAERERVTAVELAMRESRRNFDQLLREEQEGKRSLRNILSIRSRQRRPRIKTGTPAETEEILHFTQARFS